MSTVTENVNENKEIVITLYLDGIHEATSYNPNDEDKYDYVFTVNEISERLNK